jgi:small conductance mechanosensitive channel
MEKVIQKIWDKLDIWIDAFISMVPNMGSAVFLFILFILLARVGKKLTVKVFDKTSLENQALEDLFATIVYNLILGLGIFTILGILHLDKAVTSLLAGVGVLGLALGFAFQDIAANFVSGIILAFRTPFQIGDVIDVNGIMGKVASTTLRTTVIHSFTGQEIYIPNKDVLQAPIQNYTILGKRRIDLAVGVSYGDDLDKVEALVKETIGNMEGIIDRENMVFDYSAFGDSSINFNIRFWVAFPGDIGFLVMRNNAIKLIKTAFNKNNITIPFPIRTLDFGIKAGRELSQMKLNIARPERQPTNN